MMYHNIQLKKTEGAVNMKRNFTEIVFVIDESGSMFRLRSDTIGGFNSLIEKQKKEKGEAAVSTVLFSTESHVLHDRVPLEKIEPLTDSDYCPNGGTALFDAVGSAVRHIAGIHKHLRPKDVPEHTLFVITTDGEENSSRTYTAAAVRKMIRSQRKKYGWEFVFLGANINAAETAESIGISSAAAVDVAADSTGCAIQYDTMCCALSDARNGISLTETVLWRKGADDDSKRRK